jgi:hypothetical protein
VRCRGFPFWCECPQWIETGTMSTAQQPLRVDSGHSLATISRLEPPGRQAREFEKSAAAWFWRNRILSGVLGPERRNDF